MNVRDEERAWELVADDVLDRIDNLFLEGEITGPQRYDMFRKLQCLPGLGKQFRPRDYQPTLKEAIRERLGTHVPVKFPDPGPYVLAYSDFDDRLALKSNHILILRTSNGTQRGISKTL